MKKRKRCGICGPYEGIYYREKELRRDWCYYNFRERKLLRGYLCRTCYIQLKDFIKTRNGDYDFEYLISMLNYLIQGREKKIKKGIICPSYNLEKIWEKL